MTLRPLVTLAPVLLAAPAVADGVVAASANGNTVVVSTAAVAEPPPPAEPPQVTAITEVAPRPRNTLGVDALAVLPVGDYGRAVDLGVGAGVRLEVPAGRGFVTGRIGALFHSIDYGDATLTLVPVYAGYRYPLGTGSAYIAGELGITFAWATVDTPYGQMSASDSELGALVSAGARLGPFDIRAGLFTPDLDDAIGIIGSAGYDFAAF